MILREVSVVRGKGFEQDARNSVGSVWAEFKKGKVWEEGVIRSGGVCGNNEDRYVLTGPRV
jgi:hypothetical protein